MMNGLGKICLMIVGLLLVFADVQGQTIEQLTEQTRNADGLPKLTGLVQLGEAYYRQQNYRRAQEFGEAALSLSNLLAKDALEKAEAPFKFDEVLKIKVEIYQLLAATYQKQDRTGKALRYLRESKKIAEKINDKEGITKASKEIDSLKENNKKISILNNPSKALKDVTDIIVDNVDSEEGRRNATAMRGLSRETAAKTALKKGKIVNAIEQYESAVEFYNRAGDSAKVKEILVEIEKLYLTIGNNKEATKIATIRGGSKREVDAAIMETSASKDPKANAEQLEEIQSSLEEDIEKERVRGDSLRIQIQKHASSGNTQALASSLSAYERAKQRYFRYIEDSIQIAVELETTRAELQVVEQESSLQQLKMEKERSFRNWLLFSLILILGFSGVITRLFVQRRKDHMQLQEAYQELDSTLKQLKTTQTQLVSSEKMASLGQLTAGIAHEINNPINFISGNITPLKNDIDDLLVVLRKYEEAIERHELKAQFAEVENLKNELEIDYITEEITDLINGIDEGADRTTEIVKGLRNFARLDENDLKEFFVHSGLDSTLSLLKNQLQEIEVLKDYNFQGQMEGYPGKLNQVFMNILTNAIQAMPAGGLLHIRTRQLENETLEICFRDTGKGMTEEVQKRMFEPFYTTKAVGEGTGLGMSISHGIIKQHKGRIEVDSTPGQGTELRLYFPLNQTAPNEPEA